MIASDNFNRADGPVGSNWTIVIGANPPEIILNRVRNHTGEQDIAYWNVDAIGPDQFSEVKISALGQEGPAVRCSGTTCYILFGNSSAGASLATLYRINSSISFTSLGSYTMPAVGQIWRLEMSGSSLQPFIDGSPDGSPVTDSTYATGQPGFFAGDNAGLIDDWSGGDLFTGTNFAVKFQHA